METDNRITDRQHARVKTIDWREVIIQLDKLPPETTVFIGVMDQSTRTHIRKGRISYLDPRKYNIWTASIGGSRGKARLYMSKRSIKQSQQTTEQVKYNESSNDKW